MLLVLYILASNTNKQGLHDMNKNNIQQALLGAATGIILMACVLSVSIIGALIITTLKAGV
jgi:hypothetical protein